MARRPSSETGTLARVLGMTGAVLVLPSVAIGWLYWLRALTSSWPGPKVSDALPLDELPGHAQISLIVFLGVFALAALLLGRCARRLRVDGLVGGLAAGIGVGSWLYLVATISLFVVRQVPFTVALGNARSLEAVYVAAAICAIGVAAIAERPARGTRLVTITISLVVLLSLIDLVVGIAPLRLDKHGLLALLFVQKISAPAHAVSVIAGLLLLFALPGLGRRSRRAARAVVGLGLASLLLPLVGGFSLSMTVVAALVVVLVGVDRQDFSFPGSPEGVRVALRRLCVTVLATLLYGLFALFINRAASNLPFHASQATLESYRQLLGLNGRSTGPLGNEFGEWFPWSLRLVAAVGLLSATSALFAPWRQRHAPDRRSTLRARSIVKDWGLDTLAPFTLRADKTHFFYPQGPDLGVRDQVLIAYRAIRGVALVSGDPIGPEELRAPAIDAFVAFCHSRGWRVAVVGASGAQLGEYRRAGLRTLYHGDEAIIDANGFSLAGGSMKSVRQATHRLERNGYRVEVVIAGDLGARARDELMEVEGEWLKGQPRKGFVMELDDLFRLDGEDEIFVIGRDGSDKVVGFLQLAVCAPSQSLSLSFMPRATDAPNGLNAFLIVAIVDWAREHGYDAVSLNFSPFARILDPKANLDARQKVVRGGLLFIKRALNLQLDNLLLFNRHFLPRWQPRYLVYERRRHLARIALVALAAERYLPFTNLLRGRTWAPVMTARRELVHVGGRHARHARS